MPGLLTAVDYTWVNPPQNVWGSIEANAGIVCASVPALKPFFMRYLPFIISSRLRSGGTSNPSEFNALSTTAQRNRKRRFDKSYELSSRDKDAPNNSFPADHDDEATLWNKGGAKDGAANVITQVNESSSIESGPNDGHHHHATPWRQPGASVDISAGNRGPRANNVGGDIHVTKETRVTYGEV